MKHLQNLIENNSIPEPNSGCWLWLGAIDKNNYGTRRIGPRKNNKNYYAHRLAFEAFRNKIPKNLQVNHICDNSLCVNPEHLYLGTQQDNMKDKIGKLKYKRDWQKGEQHPRRILSKEDVLYIRDQRALGVSYPEIHKTFPSVSISTIRAAGNNQNWINI
jgi:hypothetical protein